MRISTAEIKMLIKECVRQGGMYTAPDFKEYIVANSGKDVTRGQISGAVSQLVDTKEIVRVGRGLFAKDMKVTANKKKSSDDLSLMEFHFLGVSANSKCIKTKYDVISGKYISIELGDARSNLATTISSIDIWKLNGENFEIVTKMRELKDFIEEIKTQCK